MTCIAVPTGTLRPKVGHQSCPVRGRPRGRFFTSSSGCAAKLFVEWSCGNPDVVGRAALAPADSADEDDTSNGPKLCSIVSRDGGEMSILPCATDCDPSIAAALGSIPSAIPLARLACLTLNDRRGLRGSMQRKQGIKAPSNIETIEFVAEIEYESLINPPCEFLILFFICCNSVRSASMPCNIPTRSVRQHDIEHKRSDVWVCEQEGRFLIARDIEMI